MFKIRLRALKLLGLERIDRRFRMAYRKGRKSFKRSYRKGHGSRIKRYGSSRGGIRL